MLRFLQIIDRARIALAVAVLGLGLAGCQTSSVPKISSLPRQCEVTLPHLTVRSDVEIHREDPFLQDLLNLGKEVRSTLHLPPAKRPVTVYLFRDEARYVRFMRDRHPGLPARRAYFIGTSKELMVYAFWGDKTMEDLRHEYTHGVLHASLKTVPLWLDEGLAEYFEVAPTGPIGLNRDHAESLSLAVHNGWKPDLRRLEQVDDVSQMQRGDYQEAWAWVHYLLQGSPDGPRQLMDYLKALEDAAVAPALASRLEADLHESEERLVVHVAGLGLSALTSHRFPPGKPEHAIAR